MTAENKQEAPKWVVGLFEENGGYDGMTSAICVGPCAGLPGGGTVIGPVVLDGSSYGQQNCEPISPDGRARMEADAALIASAHEMRDLLDDMSCADFCCSCDENNHTDEHEDICLQGMAAKLVAKASGTAS